MSKNIIVVWVFLVLTIFVCIVTIGLKYKFSKPIIDFKKGIESKAIVYAKENKKENVTISVNKLMKQGYIKTNKIGERVCNGIITVTYKNNKYNTKERVECK